MTQTEIHGPGDAHSGSQESRIDRRRVSPDPAWILLLRLANVIDELVHAQAHDRIRPTGPVEPGQRHTGTVGRNDDVHPKRVVKRPMRLDGPGCATAARCRAAAELVPQTYGNLRTRYAEV